MTDPTVTAQVRKHFGKDRGPLHALALNLARRIDGGERGSASLAKELRATLREIDLEHFGSEGDRIREAVDAALAEQAARHDGGASQPAPDAEEEASPDVVADLGARRARRIADTTAGD